MEGCQYVTAKGLENIAGTFVIGSFQTPFCRASQHETHALLITVANYTGLTELRHLNINSCYLHDSGFQKLEGESFWSLC